MGTIAIVFKHSRVTLFSLTYKYTLLLPFLYVPLHPFHFFTSASSTDGWPEASRVGGYSLVPDQEDLMTNLTSPSLWRPSAYVGGSPGFQDPIVRPQI